MTPDEASLGHPAPPNSDHHGQDAANAQTARFCRHHGPHRQAPVTRIGRISRGDRDQTIVTLGD